jgi:subtilisin family serine protease
MMKKIPALALLATLASCGMSTSPDNVKKLDLVNSAIISIRDVKDEVQTFMVRLDAQALLETATYMNGKIIIDDAQKALVLKQQADFVASLQAIDPTIHVLYSTKLSMNSVTIAAAPSVMGQVNKLPMVKNARPMSLFSAPDVVERAQVRANLEKTVQDFRTRNSVAFIGAEKARADLGLDGKGLRIGIIDTGIDYTHTMMGGSGSVEEYKAIDATLEVDSFPNEKVIGGIDLVGDKYSPGSPYKEARIPKADKNPLDYNGHGTHVAGTVAGLGDGGITSYDGVAPEAKLYAIKVFGKDSTGDAVVIAALEYSIDPNGDLDPSDRLDVVNLSLGGNYGKPSINYAEAVKNTVRAGVSVVAAAGNSGDNPFIVGAPSTALEAISVAAGVDNMIHNLQIDASQMNIDSVATNIQASFGSFSKELKEGEVVTSKAVFIGLAATDLTEEQKAAVKGNVAIIDRGVETFENKSKRALDAGAVGVAIVNNNDEPPSPPGGSNTRMEIPVVMISKKDGQTIKEALTAQKNVSFSFSTEFKFDVPEMEDTITGFSSRGPRSEDGILKPEIVAPGQQIVSADAGQGSKVARLNGTSMASPHMGGVLGLMKQRYPNLSVLDHKHILMSTAKIINDSKGVRYPVTAQGAGRVDVMKAATATLLPSRGAFSLGKMDLLVNRQKTEVLRLTNISDAEVSFTASTEFSDGLTVSEIPATTIAPGASVELPITFTLSRTGVERANYQGYLKLNGAEGLIASFPVLAVVHQSALISAPALVQDADKASVVLANASAIKGVALPFHLLGLDERKPSAGELAHIRSRACDLKSAGYRLMKKTVQGENGPEEKTFIQIGVKLFESVSNWQSCDVSIQIDGDKDGIADQEWVSTIQGRLPGLDKVATAGSYSLLLDATKAREMRALFEQVQRDSNGSDEKEEDYMEAVVELLPLTPFQMTSVNVMEMDISKLKVQDNGQLKIKLAVLNENENSIMADDFFKKEKWFNVKIPKTFTNMPERIEVGALETKSVEIAKQVNRPLVLYVPSNSDGKRDETRDMQEIILK